MLDCKAQISLASRAIRRRSDRLGHAIFRSRPGIRDALYAAAVAEFVERDFDSTTMDDVGTLGDVARATVFNHFPRKTDFIDEWSAR